jgi:hypothetical protein
MDGKNYNWMRDDEEGHMSSVLDRVARCPYCGRYVVRGLLNFIRHAIEDCPRKQNLIYTGQPKEDDIINLTKPEEK